MSQNEENMDEDVSPCKDSEGIIPGYEAIVCFDNHGRIIFKQDETVTNGTGEIIEKLKANAKTLELWTGDDGWLLEVKQGLPSPPNKACPLGGGCILPPKSNHLCAC